MVPRPRATPEPAPAGGVATAEEALERARDRVPLDAWRLDVLATAWGLAAAFFLGALFSSHGRGIPDVYLRMIPALVVAGPLIAIRGGLGDLARRLRAWRRRSHPDDPAAGESVRISSGVGAPEYARVVQVLCVLLAPCCLGGNVVGAAIFAGIALVVVVHHLWTSRLGRLTVHWSPTTLRRGEDVTFAVGVTDGGARIDDLWCVVRCLRRERLVLGLHGIDAEVWSAAVRIPPDLHVGPGTEVVASLRLPPDAPPEDRSGSRPVAWELVVLGRIGRRAYAGNVALDVV